MGLHINKPITNARPKYSLNIGNVWLIVGLGNIGKEYDRTRHNIGFSVLDKLASEQDITWRDHRDLRCVLSSYFVGNDKMILCKPTTFMNSSGEAVQAVQGFYKITNQNTIVIHDELDIDFGKIRFAKGGSSAGHNGIKSLIENVGPDFNRIRIGIGPKLHPEQDSADFVLGTFSAEQSTKLTKIYEPIASTLQQWLTTKNYTGETISF
jgi:peptidyl-tRNA hydrolase, PTH1 family